jgi:hypothetical protein
MQSHALRLYVVSATVLVFFVLWAVIAARPWAAKAASPGVDPRLAALDRREQRLRREAQTVNRTIARRWHAYHRRLQAREALIRELQRTHARQLAAAARAAAASVAAPVASYSAGASAAGSQVVTLPPRVRVVTLPGPPATSSGSSHP